MTGGRRRLAALGRIAALLSTAAVLLATSSTPCGTGDTSTWTAETSCGPAGAITLSYAGDEGRNGSGCGGCWAFVEAPGANAVGLPEQGEISAGYEHTFEDGEFALVGPAPLAGASPPAVVERACRFTSSSPGTLEVSCTGEAPEAACAGTLTRVAAEGT